MKKLCTTESKENGKTANKFKCHIVQSFHIHQGEPEIEFLCLKKKLYLGFC